jgi:hypothetical protein
MRRDSMKKTLTRSKGGTAEREVDIASIDIPDLWHIATWLKEQKRAVDGVTITSLHQQADMILDCWHLSHDMRKMLQEMLAETKTANK